MNIFMTSNLPLWSIFPTFVTIIEVQKKKTIHHLKWFWQIVDSVVEGFRRDEAEWSMAV